MSALDIAHNNQHCLDWDEDGEPYPYSVTGDIPHVNPWSSRHYATSQSYMTGCWRCVLEVLQDARAFDHFLVIPLATGGWRVVAGFGEYLGRISDWKPAATSRYQLDFRLVPQLRPVQLRRTTHGWEMADQEL